MSHNISAERPFGALVTAMVTPMHEDGSLDIPTAVRIAGHLADTGHDAIVLNGTTGESPTTHTPEKQELIQAVVEAVGDDVMIIAGAGSNDTKHAVRIAEASAESGAHGLLVVTPYYNRPTQDGAVAHFEAVADSTDLPVMLYDIPGRSGVRIAHESFAKLAEHEKILAVKDATGDVYSSLKVARDTGLVYYSGDDPLNLAFMALGAAGVVSVVGHLVGPAMRTMIDAIDRGDLAAARSAFAQTAPVIDAVMGSGQGAMRVKAGLQLLDLLPSVTTRLPVLPPQSEDFEIVRTAMKASGILD